MQLLRSWPTLSPHQRGGVLTLGNFDGVHLGHQQLLQHVVHYAEKYQIPAFVMTFEPYPQEYFSQVALQDVVGSKVRRLMSLREKYLALQAYPLHSLIVLRFNDRLQNMTAVQFVRMIHHCLGPRHIVVGQDFRFGYRRAGNVALLGQLGQKLGFSVETVSTVTCHHHRVSSTAIRQALAEGQQAWAAELLGRAYRIHGRVIRGEQRGRLWGIPTANINPKRLCPAVHGVYTVLVHGLTTQPLPGVASIGTRPTVDGSHWVLEVHLLNFNRNIYGHYVQVEFCTKLREEKHYSSISALQQQMHCDVVAAQNYFQSAHS